MNASTYISSFDSTKLYLKKNIIDNPKAIVLIVHGLCEHSGRYDYVSKKLNGFNFSVYRFDHRGHANSEGKKIFYSNFNEIIEDVNAVVEYVKENHKNVPIFLLGHSMGGFAVTSFGTKYPNKVKGIITTGALTRDNNNLLENIEKNLPVDTYFPNELGNGVCSDAKVVEEYAKDPLVDKSISAGLFYALKDGINWLKNNSNNFIDSILLLHGCNDGLVIEKDSRDFYGEILSKDKSLKIYPFLMHEILNEKDKDIILDEIKLWIDKRV